MSIYYSSEYQHILLPDIYVIHFIKKKKMQIIKSKIYFSILNSETEIKFFDTTGKISQREEVD